MIEEYKRTYRHLVEPSLPSTPTTERSPSPINMNNTHGKRDNSVQDSNPDANEPGTTTTTSTIGRYQVPQGYAGHASMGDGYTGYQIDIDDSAVRALKPAKKRTGNVIIC